LRYEKSKGKCGRKYGTALQIKPSSGSTRVSDVLQLRTPFGARAVEVLRVSYPAPGAA
jgi:hypothetical protein